MRDIFNSLDLPILSASIKARVTRDIRWNSFPGSVVHGVLGFKLKNLSCVVSHRNCRRCYVVHTCSYGTIYESPLPPDTKRMRLYPQAPHPIRIAVYPWDRPELKTSETFEVVIVLMGKAVTNSLLLILSLDGALKEGVGRKYGGERGRAEIISLKDRISGKEKEWKDLKDDYSDFISAVALKNLKRSKKAGDIAVHIRSPLKIITDGKSNFNPSLRDITSTLLRRLSNLSYFYNEKEIPLDYQSLLSKAESSPYSSEFKKVGAIRYSSRQSKTISMGGITGKMTIESCVPEISALLDVGVHIGLGKGTTMGLGDYSVL